MNRMIHHNYICTILHMHHMNCALHYTQDLIVGLIEVHHHCITADQARSVLEVGNILHLHIV